jgi:hypothetical protein
MSDHTRVNEQLQFTFPANAEEYAPWVATYGLRAPYGECQCGCGNRTPLGKATNYARGLIKGKPTRWINGHHPSPALAKDRLRVTRPLMERFWEKVNRRGPDECWEWMGSRNGAGYGKIGKSGNSRYAHRISYEMAYGAIPGDLYVCHRCDNPSCVNPNHLFAGSCLDNVLDMIRKGRSPHEKLAFLDIEAMEQMRVDGYSYRSIGAQFKISESGVRKIAKRYDWRRRFGARGLR